MQGLLGTCLDAVLRSWPLIEECMLTSASLGIDADSGESVSTRDAGAEMQALYAAHSTMVWRALRRFGVPEQSVEDAVQDVFLNAYRRLPAFERRSSVTTWLYAIAQRVAKDYRRAQMRRDRREARLRSEQPVGVWSAQGPADAVARREANRLLHQLLDELPQRERKLFVLVELEGLAVREAAEALGLRIRTCQRHLKVARAAFESALARYKRERGL
jgi:RNA polymerase sigma-70 factor (ECF subfamily)